MTHSTTRIAFASVIEFYDFYIYGLAVAAISVLAAWLIHGTRDRELA